MVIPSSYCGRNGAEERVGERVYGVLRSLGKERYTYRAEYTNIFIGALCSDALCDVKLTHIEDLLGLQEGDRAASCVGCRLSGREVERSSVNESVSTLKYSSSQQLFCKCGISIYPL